MSNTDTSKWREDAELVASRIMADYGALMVWVVKHPKVAVYLTAVIFSLLGYGVGRL